MTARHELDRLRRIEYQVRAYLADLETTSERAKLLGRKPPGKAKGAADPTSGENIWAELDGIRQRLRHTVIYLERLKDRARQVIDDIPDGEHRTVLIWRYINAGAWEDIADAIGCSERTTYRLHGEALLAYERARNQAQAEELKK